VTNTHKLFNMHLLLFTRTGAIDKNFLSYVFPGSTSISRQLVPIAKCM